MVDTRKAARGERARIEALIAREEARVRRAFRQFLDAVRSEGVRRQVRRALERDGIEAALRITDGYVARLGTALTDTFRSAATSEASTIGAQLGRRAAYIAISFDPTDARAADAMRRNTLEFVREFTRSQRESTRAALTDALRAGEGPAATARAFRDSIGLTQAQRQAVANYRRLLETADAQALTRDLRDRRFDASVRRAIEEGEPLGAARINKMVAQYRNRYLQYRGENIARTEVKRAVGAARDEARRQILDQTGLPASAIRRRWNVTRDGRQRDTHDEMGGQTRALNEPFNSPSGAQMMYPGDASLGAPASEIINCRCVETTEVDPTAALS